MLTIDWRGFGQQVLLARRRLKLSQAEAAQCIGISRNYLSQIELGKADLSYAIVVSICQSLNINFSANGLCAMTITHEDAAHLDVIVREETDALLRRLRERIHARSVAGLQNEEWQPVAAKALDENRVLRDRCDTLAGEMERIAAERDRLMQRVMELEKRLQKRGSE